MMKDAVLFDLGNTLVQYFERTEFPAILEQALIGVQDHFRQEGLLRVSPGAVWQNVKDENREAGDHRVRPLEERLARIFQLDPGQIEDVAPAMCRRFMEPIFARGRVYQDSLPTLRELKARGLKTAIVSNTPWGSPGSLWREEVQRLGLSEIADVVVFCTDVGWRKPARPIFEYALEGLQTPPQHCVFVGDDPRWDLAGPRAIGMEAILIDRHGAMGDAGEDSIQNLHELWKKIG